MTRSLRLDLFHHLKAPVDVTLELIYVARFVVLTFINNSEVSKEWFYRKEKLDELYVDIRRSKLRLAIVLAEIVAIKFKTDRFSVLMWLQLRPPSRADIIHGPLVNYALQNSSRLVDVTREPAAVLGESLCCDNRGIALIVALGAPLKMDGDAHL